MDYDSIGADDLIGTVVVDISEAEQFANEAPLPSWRVLKRGKDEPYCGEILISFNLYDNDVP
eukprot:CAMPEP_0168316794 /NCGR_PEP_ID=MMETSP0210-20121227/19245_1 /TAXON_ID=40633 /ORGANISM="Condylostoma magnum, Strain COL2" /LENGTH=61 /DNA_ID=CAMNT_0008304603 /DNA_START=79 /DNA_END=264 /DNA_ORIENTATION=-